MKEKICIVTLSLETWCFAKVFIKNTKWAVNVEKENSTDGEKIQTKQWVSFLLFTKLAKLFLMILNLDPDGLNTEFLCGTGENIDYY